MATAEEEGAFALGFLLPGSALLGATLELFRPGTFREALGIARITAAARATGRVVITTTKSTLARVPLARISRAAVVAKKAALPALPIEIALVYIGHTTPFFKDIKTQVQRIGSSDPDEFRAGVLALDLTLLGTGFASIGLASLAVGLGPQAIPVAASIATAIFLEILIA